MSVFKMYHSSPFSRCSQSTANLLRQLINDSQSSAPDHHVPHFSVENGPSASQVLVMGPDDYIVAIVRLEFSFFLSLYANSEMDLHI